MPKCLITGGAGFVGSHLAEWLLERGHSVIVIDNLSSGRIGNIEPLMSHPNFWFERNDAGAAGPLAELVDDVDVIFHLAASVGVFNIIQSPVTTIENNIDTTVHVLQAAARNKTKVVLASTSEVYGKNDNESFHEESNLVLGPTSKSRWSYAASKIVDEFLALAFCREFDVPTVVVRLFNTIGPRQVGRYGMVVPRFIGQAVRNEPVTVYGDGRQTRCFTYVSDVVCWLGMLAENDRAVGQVFNLGNPREVSIADLARMVISHLQSSSTVKFLPYEQAYEDGFDDMRRRVPDITKVIELTGYRPKVPLEEALRRTCDWFIEQNSSDDSPSEAELHSM